MRADVERLAKSMGVTYSEAHQQDYLSVTFDAPEGYTFDASGAHCLVIETERDDRTTSRMFWNDALRELRAGMTACDCEICLELDSSITKLEQRIEIEYQKLLNTDPVARAGKNLAESLDLDTVTALKLVVVQLGSARAKNMESLKELLNLTPPNPIVVTQVKGMKR